MSKGEGIVMSAAGPLPRREGPLGGQRPHEVGKRGGTTALILAGGTGGHIFPALAVAQALRERGWNVHWLGGAGAPGAPSMESEKVPAAGFAFHAVDFGGVRGKGLLTLLKLPLRLLRAFAQSWRVLREVRPCVVVGFGGYISFPAGVMAAVARTPLLLHEQNSVAGMANRWLAKLATRVFTAFPDVLPQALWVGNPLRAAFTRQAPPAERFAGRSGPLRVLVVGGSLGARALNDVVPRALALLGTQERPVVTHQSGARQIDELRANYAAAGVQAELTPFIEDTASAYAQADLIICRAGASTVTEIAAVGAAAIYVPFPAAVDDHQSVNADFLVRAGAGWLQPQATLTPEVLAGLLRRMDRAELLQRAEAAKRQEKPAATEELVQSCLEVCA